MDELVARALQNSPQLPLARENLEAARQRAGGARRPLNPALQVVPRLAGSRQAADTEILVSQVLDVFGKRRTQAAVLNAQVRGAEAATLLAQRSLVVQVKNAAADLFAAQEAENLGVFQAEVARLFRDAAARRAQLGDVPTVQAQRAELEVLRVENELIGARAERLARRAALNGIIGQAPETTLRVALPIATDFAAVLQSSSLERPVSPGTNSPLATTDSTAPPRGENDALNADALNTPILGASSQIEANLVAQRTALLPGALQRPDIAGAQASLEARQAQVRAIVRTRYPDIEIQLRRGSFFGEGSSSTALRAVVNVPIFDFGSISREKKAAQAEVRAGQAQLTLLRQTAATQVEQALVRLAQQRLTVETYRTGIVPQTLDLLRKTQIGYAQGASTYLEVLEAQRTLRAVQTEYLQALVGTRSSEAALESALGATPPANSLGAVSNSQATSNPPGTTPEATLLPDLATASNPPFADLPATSTPQGQSNRLRSTP